MCECVSSLSFFFLGYGRKTYRFIPEDLCDSAGSPRSEASTSSRVADPGDCWSGGREKVGTIAAADVGDEAVVVGPWSWWVGEFEMTVFLLMIFFLFVCSAKSWQI